MKIGRTVRVLTDYSRHEVLSEKEENRRIIISIFYPADEQYEVEGMPKYIELFAPAAGEFIKELAESGVKEEFIRSLETNAYAEAPVNKDNKSYPVVIYSPGLGSHRDASMFNIEALVQAGYIVITVGHTYDADITAFPDGEIIRQSEEIQGTGPDKRRAAFKFVKVRKDDVIFIIDELLKLNKEDEVLKGKLALDRMAVMGHSLGGATAFEAAAEDKRGKAVIMLDGSLHTITASERLQKGESLDTPLLLFRKGLSNYMDRISDFVEKNKEKLDGGTFKRIIVEEEAAARGFQLGQEKLYEYLTGYKSFVKIKNSEHMTYTDYPMLRNREFENGTLPIKKAYEIINTCTVKFLNEFLSGSTNEFKSFLENNDFEELCLINARGEVV